MGRSVEGISAAHWLIYQDLKMVAAVQKGNRHV